MKYVITAALAVIGVLLLIFFFAFGSGEFRKVAAPAPDCVANFFDKQARVFDAITICGTTGVSEAKLKHAASVAAQWLDNDQDGVADEPLLIQALQENNPILVMSGTGFSAPAFLKLAPIFASAVGQDLAANETAPVDGRDASQEEIHHLIVNAGWQKLFPSVFSDRADQASSLFTQWQRAEDGRHYSYDDPTCDSACKTVEFFYLATAAYLGSEADLESDEMRIKNRADLRTHLPGIVAIIESDEYNYPVTRWPDGQYPTDLNIAYSGI